MGADGEGYTGRAKDLAAGQLAEPPPDFRAAHRAAWAFAEQAPSHSAWQTLTPDQGRAVKQLAALTGIAALLWLEACLVLASTCLLGFFLAAICFRLAACLTGAPASSGPPAGRPFELLKLPVYTILIALKDEMATIPQLAESLRRLNYPAGLIDLKLLIEAGDTATRDALLAECWPGDAELLIVPPGEPRTKPRALNYGLAQARGEFVVVFDAEDRPHPDQLLAAIRAFRKGPAQLACLQAPLAGHGARGWLAAHWALEYAIQFGRLMPGLAALRLPIALGGTSNHFRRRSLVSAGAWDPWNVTEDADLGLRLARAGYKVGMITPPTLEAPPERLGVWIAQRSRWLKGYLQTWLVIMRRPVSALRELGFASFLSVQLTLGAALLAALVHGPWVLWLLVGMAVPELAPSPVFLAAAGFSYVASLFIALIAPGGRGLPRLFLALTLPLYWPLQSIAMARAVYGLLRRPHFWAKTPHEHTGDAPGHFGTGTFGMRSGLTRAEASDAA
ncbi:glycosyltransferase family 2 protein [Hyphomonas sp.]|uniref:glycosyltransferase family 2 protein n=1 Tax=Hyphomonas sp. TaxID=87 RepID=UPI00391BBE47